MGGPLLHPRLGARRGGARARTWWGKAWVRALEEAAYADGDLVAARSLARGGNVGRITTEPGRVVASVEDPHGLWTVEVRVPVLDDAGRDAMVETVAAESGRIAVLLAGDLPHDLVEQAEEAGAELLPYGGELEASCDCEHWADPCVHALAVLQQLAWLVDADPLLLLQLRGLPREDLLGRLHRLSAPADAQDADLDLAVEAALYAARVLTEEPPAPSG